MCWMMTCFAEHNGGAHLQRIEQVGRHVLDAISERSYQVTHHSASAYPRQSRHNRPPGKKRSEPGDGEGTDAGCDHQARSEAGMPFHL